MAKAMDGQQAMEKDPKQFVHKDSLRGGKHEKLREEVKEEQIMVGMEREV